MFTAAQAAEKIEACSNEACSMFTAAQAAEKVFLLPVFTAAQAAEKLTKFHAYR